MKSASRIRLWTILFALVSGVFALILKFYAAKISDSSALRSDALESIVNVAAAIFGLISILISEKPADRDHPYGHGKIEYFSSAFEGSLISFAGILILIDTVSRILHHVSPESLGAGLKINLCAGMINGVSGGLIYFAGKKYKSQVLLADGIHLLSDLITTVSLGVGLGLALLTGWKWLDPVLAFGVSGMILYTGYSLLKSSLSALLDAESPALLKEIVDFVNQNERDQIITIHELKAQQFGRDKHVDVHLVVPEYLTVKQAHRSSDRFGEALRKKLGAESVVHTHLDPCERLFCKECPFLDCAIRKSAFECVRPVTVESAVRTGVI